MKTVEEIKKALEEKGIKIYIDGCGCCASPWWKIEIDGIVSDDMDGDSINMFEEDK